MRRVRILIPRKLLPTNWYRYPWGSLVWRTEPGIKLPASPGALSEEYVTREHTQSTGPGVRSVYDPGNYISTPFTDKRPSIVKEEI